MGRRPRRERGEPQEEGEVSLRRERGGPQGEGGHRISPGRSNFGGVPGFLFAYRLKKH